MTFKRLEPLIIADASPLIGLAKIRRADLLFSLAEEVWIPAAVWKEVVERDQSRPEVGLIRSSFANAVREVPDGEAAVFRDKVDAGEAAALALAARRPNALLLIDDHRGRMLAEQHGFRLLGTLGLLLRAKRAGLVPSVKAETDALLRNGLYLDASLISRVLNAAGE